MSLGAKLTTLRSKNNKSLQDVADAVGLSKTHIWELEKGRSKNPSREVLTKLADYFSVSVADLIGENPNAEGEDPTLIALYRNLKELKPDELETIRILMERLKKTKG